MPCAIYGKRIGMLLYLLILLGSCPWAQYPVYQPPLEGSLLVTGTFGELRSDHFHAGLDFRGAVGTPVYAVADGYISRLVVSPGGYGQAIYIDHPMGYRSVYGHLDAFLPALLDTIRAYQQAQQSFGIQLRFEPGVFPVRQGDRIGSVGNRGFSFGPHLHFEIRDSQTDSPLNPLHFGIRIQDSRPPQLRKLKLYALDPSSNTYAGQELTLKKNTATQYQLAQPILVSPYPRIGLGIKAYDQQDGLPNYNGIYAVQLYVNEQLHHAFRYDSIAFEETRYLNAHTDYEDWVLNKSWYHRLFRLPGDHLSIYSPLATAAAQGVLSLTAHDTLNIRLLVKDWAGNSSELSFRLLYQPNGQPIPEQPHNYFLPQAKTSILAWDDAQLEVPANALYTDCLLRYQAVYDPDQSLWSRVHHLHHPATPLHQAALLSIAANRRIPSHLKTKIVVANCPKDPQTIPTSYGPAYDEAGQVQAVPIRQFGDYVLMMDTLAPVITLLSLPSPKQRQAPIRFKISDNFNSSGNARSLRYQAYLNGQWFLLEDDRKNQELFHHFPKALPAGNYLLELQVKDDRGNETKQTFSFQL